MTESWKAVVDGDRLTISSDAFTFTSGTDPMRLETVLADLQGALRGMYGQYCGVSRAAEMVGERWGFLIVRDLLMGPKSVAELCDGLPMMPPDLLSRRLRELVFCNVVQRVDEDDEDVADEQVRYELTEYGRASEDAVMAFGRWGAAALGTPRPEDIVTDAGLMFALKGTFVPEAAEDIQVSYEVNVANHLLGIRIDRGALTLSAGPMPDADASMDFGTVFLPLLTGELTPEDALATGQVRVTGDPALLSRFVAMFRLPMMAAPKVPV
jgi:DNA-binding HxlR family transcriptional regulator